MVFGVQGKVYTPVGLFAQGVDWSSIQAIDPQDILDVSDESDSDSDSFEPKSVDTQ